MSSHDDGDRPWGHQEKAELTQPESRKKNKQDLVEQEAKLNQKPKAATTYIVHFMSGVLVCGGVALAAVIFEIVF